ncbi:5'(3')-deoxyribonucleotidase [Haloarcula virus HCTV-16]|nr:5'(3')-deoxyribonucleotidase [Haloarcula virus HCTV-16]
MSVTEKYQPPKVALDMESVLADTHGVYIAALNGRHGTDYSYDEVDDWDWVDQDGRDYEEFMEIVHEAWSKTWRTMPSVEREEIQFESVASISEKLIVHVVTARQGVEVEMRKWLEMKHILPHISEFHSVEPGKSKADLDYDYYIDDKPQLADRIDEDDTLFLFDQPWNQHVEERDNVYRVSSLAEVEKVFTLDGPDLR